MAGYANELIEVFDEKASLQIAPQKTNVLSNKITSVLSASYGDSEVRDALQTLEDRKVRNSAETRRRLRLDVQKEVITRNGDIVKDFGQVAEVCLALPPWKLALNNLSN